VERPGPLPPETPEPAQVIRTLHALVRFETFDALAGDDQTPTEVTHIVTGLVRCFLGGSG